MCPAGRRARRARTPALPGRVQSRSGLKIGLLIFIGLEKVRWECPGLFAGGRKTAIAVDFNAGPIQLLFGAFQKVAFQVGREQGIGRPGRQGHGHARAG